MNVKFMHFMGEILVQKIDTKEGQYQKEY